MRIRPADSASLRIAALAAAFVGTDLVIRAVSGGPYPGATALLVLACGVSMLPFQPEALRHASLRAAVAPALGIVSFAVLLTTASLVGITLDELTIRVAVIAFVVGIGALAAFVRTAESTDTTAPSSRTTEAFACAALAVISLFALASAWDLVGPFPPPGVDWGHYLLYADEVERQGGLLIRDPFALDDRIFADSPGVGALYGGVRILDGVSSEWLAYGLIVISALSPLTVYVATRALWGLTAGLIAAGAYAVAPIRIDPIRWHGVGTELGLVFFPLVVLALGCMYRGDRRWRVVMLLGTAVLGVLVTHSTSTFVLAFVLATALVVDAVRQVVRHRSFSLRVLLRWWSEGIVRPVVLAAVFTALVGAGVLAHLRSQAADLGEPVSYRLFEPDWLSWQVFVDYYSLAFLAVTAASLVLVLASPLRHDAALLAVLSLAVACVVVGELWRLEVPFEYRRAVFYVGVAMAMVIGAGSLRLPRTAWSAVGYALVFAYIAHVSVGLRLPERVASGIGEPKGGASERLIQFAEQLGPAQDRSPVVADKCMNFVVPYVLQRPTLVAFEPWQVGFESRVPLAERAAGILAGGRMGRELAGALGVRYVVANPSCSPLLQERLGGDAVVDTDELVVLDLREPAEESG